MRLLAFVVLLTGCPQDWADLFDPTPDGTDPDRPDNRDDTGTAFVAWHGHVKFDAEADRLEAARGIAAVRATDQAYICDIAADFTSIGAGAPGCPDCAWSFAVQVTGGGTTGDYCDAFTRPTLFDSYGYYDFYFSTWVDGFGWTESFTYEYGSYVYDLEDVVWAHVEGTRPYDGMRYSGWYLYGYNFAGTKTGVEGDRYEAEFLRYAAGNNGQRLYYYFYY